MPMPPPQGPGPLQGLPLRDRRTGSAAGNAGRPHGRRRGPPAAGNAGRPQRRRQGPPAPPAPPPHGRLLPLLAVLPLLLLLAGPRAAAGYAVGAERLFWDAPEEVPEPRAVAVAEGALPAWLRGSLFRNGPGVFGVGRRRARVGFDGMAKPHRWAVADGRLTFQTRFLRSDSYNRSVAAGTVAPQLTFGRLDPCISIFGKAMALFEPNDNNFVSVKRVGDALLTLSDHFGAVVIDPETLGTVESTQFTPKPPLRVYTVGSAHPQDDPTHPGAIVNHVTSVGLPVEVEVYRLLPDLRKERVGPLKTDKVSYMHSFSVVDNLAFFFFYPAIWDVVCISTLHPLNECIKWEGAERRTRIHVVDLNTGATVHELETDPVFSFHHINAYRAEADRVVVNLVAFENSDVIRQFWDFPIDTWADAAARDVPRPDCIPRPRQYVLDLASGTVTYEDLRDEKAGDVGAVAARMELPRINDRFARRAHCFVYGLVMNVGAPELWAAAGISKFDLCGGGGSKVWSADDHYPSEPIFVARPGATAEDDGVILSSVLDGTAGKSYLLVLDARTFEPVAKSAHTPVAVPFSFHGAFYGDAEQGARGRSGDGAGSGF